MTSNKLTRSGDPLQELNTTLNEHRSQLAAVLPAHISPERMVRLVVTAATTNEQLFDCSPLSLARVMMQAGQLGLEIDNGLGHAWIVKYRGAAQLVTGYRGMIDLARRSGEITVVEGRIVKPGDAFAYSYGLNPDLTHKARVKLPEGEDKTNRRALTHAYVIVHWRNKQAQFDVMEFDEIEAIRKRSPRGAKGIGPWATDYAEMAKKTVFRRMAKWLPLSSAAQRQMTREDRMDAGMAIDVEVSDGVTEEVEHRNGLGRGREDAPALDWPEGEFSADGGPPGGPASGNPPIDV